jgi:hypothetical protein
MGAGRGAADYEDEPTLPEDLEDEEFPILRPAPAPVVAARCVAAARACRVYCLALLVVWVVANLRLLLSQVAV